MTRYAKRKLKYSFNENLNLLPYVEWDRFVTLIVGCPTNDFCEFALTELHTPVCYIVGMRRTSCIEIKMSSLGIVVTFFLDWGQRSRSKNWN